MADMTVWIHDELVQIKEIALKRLKIERRRFWLFAFVVALATWSVLNV